MLLLNCIIDGNYLLHRLVFSLHKNNLLFGGLEKSLEVAISNYRRLYPFTTIYFVSDSKKKSWRAKLDQNYKTHRKKNQDIDWDFVYSTYKAFKEELPAKKIKLFELDHIEGDDWMSLIVLETNKRKQSNLLITNDYDIKQLINFNLVDDTINLMTNETFKKQKYFLPKNYKIFVDKIARSSGTNSIFDMNDDQDFLEFIKLIEEKYEIIEIDSVYSLLIKVISGDDSDNISSVFVKKTNSGKNRGVGVEGAKSILEKYKSEFGEISLADPDIYDNIADLICEKKKISRSSLDRISDNIKRNMNIITLDSSLWPKEIIERMNTLKI